MSSAGLSFPGLHSPRARLQTIGVMDLPTAPSFVAVGSPCPLPRRPQTCISRVCLAARQPSQSRADVKVSTGMQKRSSEWRKTKGDSVTALSHLVNTNAPLQNNRGHRNDELTIFLLTEQLQRTQLQGREAERRTELTAALVHCAATASGPPPCRPEQLDGNPSASHGEARVIPRRSQKTVHRIDCEVSCNTPLCCNDGVHQRRTVGADGRQRGPAAERPKSSSCKQRQKEKNDGELRGGSADLGASLLGGQEVASHPTEFRYVRDSELLRVLQCAEARITFLEKERRAFCGTTVSDEVFNAASLHEYKREFVAAADVTRAAATEDGEEEGVTRRMDCTGSSPYQAITPHLSIL